MKLGDGKKQKIFANIGKMKEKNGFSSVIGLFTIEFVSAKAWFYGGMPVTNLEKEDGNVM